MHFKVLRRGIAAQDADEPIPPSYATDPSQVSSSTFTKMPSSALSAGKGARCRYRLRPLPVDDTGDIVVLVNEDVAALARLCA
jgi:hypothetical protein